MQNIPVDVAIDKYLNLQRAISSERTVRYYAEIFDLFKAYTYELGVDYVSQISQDDFLEYVKMLRKKGIKNTSVNTYTRGIRAFANWCVDNDYLAKSFCTGIKQLRDDSAQIFPLTTHQVLVIDKYFGIMTFAISGYKETGSFDLRNFVLFHLMLDCGLRRQEVINLNVEDVQVNCLVIRNSKCNKSRIVPLPQWLYDYIRLEIGHRKSGPVLLSRNGDRITEDGVKKVFYDISNDTSIHVYPHLLRHTFATSYIAGGGNLEFLRIILGHASYNITQRYVHIASQCVISDIDIYKLDSVFFKNYNNRNTR